MPRFSSMPGQTSTGELLESAFQQQFQSRLEVRLIQCDNSDMSESVTLSIEHRQALQSGQSVAVTEVTSQLECVVLRADVFEQIKKLLPDFDPRDAYPALDEVMSEDWNDPKMAEYDDYESRKKCDLIRYV